MKKIHLNILRDPYTGEKLELVVKESDKDEIISGELFSNSNKYEISNGIPRFVNQNNYSNNFSLQWRRWSRVQFDANNISKPMEDYTRNMFESITELNKEKLKGKSVLDLGCGSGRFADIAINFGATVVLLDNSNSIDIAKNILGDNDKDILFVQGDALMLPFENKMFDYVFSIGVLHHTPNPQKGVAESFRVLKPKGEFSLSVYSDGSNYTFKVVHIWRYIFNKLSPILKYYPPILYAYFFGTLNYILSKFHIFLTYPVRIFFPSVVLKDLRWSILDTFDLLTTSYQSGTTIYEAYYWLKNTGFSIVRPGRWGVNLIGTKE